jgi:hypothetical protein
VATTCSLGPGYHSKSARPRSNPNVRIVLVVRVPRRASTAGLPPEMPLRHLLVLVVAAAILDFALGFNLPSALPASKGAAFVARSPLAPAKRDVLVGAFQMVASGAERNAAKAGRLTRLRMKVSHAIITSVSLSYPGVLLTWPGIRCPTPRPTRGLGGTLSRTDAHLNASRCRLHSSGRRSSSQRGYSQRGETRLASSTPCLPARQPRTGANRAKSSRWGEAAAGSWSCLPRRHPRFSSSLLRCTLKSWTLGQSPLSPC